MTMVAVAATAVLGATLAFGSATGAPGRVSKPAMADDGAASLMRALNLTPAQVQQLQAIHQRLAAQVQAVKANPSLSIADRQAQLQAIMAPAHPQLLSVLIAGQIQALQSMAGPSGWSRRPGACGAWYRSTRWRVRPSTRREMYSAWSVMTRAAPTTAVKP